MTAIISLDNLDKTKPVELAGRFLRAIEITYIAIPKEKAEVFEQIKKFLQGIL